MCTGCLGIIIQGVRCQIELLVTQTNIIIEHRHFGIRMILSPVTSQRRAIIYEFSSLKEISEIIQSVVIKTICIQSRLTMFQDDIITSLGYLSITIIIGIVAKQFQRIPL